VKITENTNIYLEVEDRNRQYLWRLLLALPLVAVGLGLTLATVKVTSLECLRQADKSSICQRTIAGILGDEEDRIPGELRSVKVTKASGVGIVLGTTTGEVELAPYRTFVTERHERNADRLNAFLKDTQQTKIEIEQDDRLINSMWGGSMLIGGLTIGLFALAIPVRMSCKFDRLRDRTIIDKQYLVYGNRQTILTLSQLDRAQVRELPFVRNRQPAYTIDLIPANTKKVSLSVPSENLAESEQIVSEIDRFIKN
jgi:hypothetical protein